MNKKVITIFSFVFILSCSSSFSVSCSQNDKPVNEKNQAVSVKIKSIPYEMSFHNHPEKYEIIENNSIDITSKAGTNLFNSPSGKYYKQDAPMLLFKPDSNFVFRAKITAELEDIYDVAALVLYQDDDYWAKLCFENSINKEATVVSVVTRRYSDDCNSIKIDGNYAFLSVAKNKNEFSFHCSKDGKNWELIRHFRMEFSENMRLGFAVHCSRGNGFSANFSSIQYSPVTLDEMR